MSLRYDISRCHGAKFSIEGVSFNGGSKTSLFALCNGCARTDKGREEHQSYILPALDLTNGNCRNYIERVKND